MSRSRTDRVSAAVRKHGRAASCLLLRARRPPLRTCHDPDIENSNGARGAKTMLPLR